MLSFCANKVVVRQHASSNPLSSLMVSLLVPVVKVAVSIIVMVGARSLRHAVQHHPTGLLEYAVNSSCARLNAVFVVTPNRAI